MAVIPSGPAFADWQTYWKDKNITADFDYLSREPFRGKPSIWVKLYYATPRKEIGGVKTQFTADCAGHRLYEIASDQFDTGGNFLGLNKHYDSPKEYKMTPGSLNEATYRLMCR